MRDWTNTERELSACSTSSTLVKASPTFSAAFSTFVANLLWMTALLIIGAGAGAATFDLAERMAELRMACMVMVCVDSTARACRNVAAVVACEWKREEL